MAKKQTITPEMLVKAGWSELKNPPTTRLKYKDTKSFSRTIDTIVFDVDFMYDYRLNESRILLYVQDQDTEQEKWIARQLSLSSKISKREFNTLLDIIQCQDFKIDFT
jgi:hypothetical protein